MYSRRWLFVLALLAGMGAALAACGVAPPQTSDSSAATPLASSAPATAEAAPTAAQLATSGPFADTNPAKPDDKTQARLRVSYCLAGGPHASVLIDGKVAVNGGMPQDNIVSSQASGYLYLAPGTYSVAIVPTSKSLDQALLAPTQVSVVAGHRYTVVALGQIDEPSHKALVIDETEAYERAGVTPSATGQITVNNIRGARGISFQQDGMGAKDVPYGGFAAAAIPFGTIKDFKVIYSGPSDQIVENNGVGYNAPAIDYLDCFHGIYPNQRNTFTSVATSSLNTIDFLQAQSDLNTKVGRPEWAFTTLLTALKRVGLTEQLASGGPFMIFAPTDEAFAALPKDKRDALMADPKALADTLRRYIVPGYYPYGSLSRAPVTSGFNRTVTNLRGEQLKLSGDEHDLTINGQSMGFLGPIDPLMIADGVRLISVSKLLPDAK